MKQYQTVVLGAGGVGKSSLTLRFIRGEFFEAYDPTIEESYRKDVELDGEICYINILDTAGAEQFASINEFYIQGSTGYILVFSLTQASSLREVEQLRKQIYRIKRLPTPPSLDIAAILSGASGTSSPGPRPSFTGDYESHTPTSVSLATPPAGIAGYGSAGDASPPTSRMFRQQQGKRAQGHLPQGSISSHSRDVSPSSSRAPNAQVGSVTYGPAAGTVALDTASVMTTSSSRHQPHAQSSPPPRTPNNNVTYHQSRPSLSTAAARGRGVGAEEAMAKDDHFFHIPSNVNETPMSIVLVGTKSDLPSDREVSRDAAVKISQMWGCPFFETSSKQNLNVDEVFMHIVQSMKEAPDAPEPSGRHKKTPLIPRRPSKKKRCVIQ